jgi:branched-subunit amino acid transport protein
VSWWTLLTIAAGAYAFKALGLAVIGSRTMPARVTACLDLLPAALLPALIVANTVVTTDRQMTIDARLAGVAVAALLAWRKAPFPVVIGLAAATTALVRAFS